MSHSYSHDTINIEGGNKVSITGGSVNWQDESEFAFTAEDLKALKANDKVKGHPSITVAEVEGNRVTVLLDIGDSDTFEGQVYETGHRHQYDFDLESGKVAEVSPVQDRFKYHTITLEGEIDLPIGVGELETNRVGTVITNHRLTNFHQNTDCRTSTELHIVDKGEDGIISAVVTETWGINKVNTQDYNYPQNELGYEETIEVKKQYEVDPKNKENPIKEVPLEAKYKDNPSQFMASDEVAEGEDRGVAGTSQAVEAGKQNQVG